MLLCFILLSFPSHTAGRERASASRPVFRAFVYILYTLAGWLRWILLETRKHLVIGNFCQPSACVVVVAFPGFLKKSHDGVW